MVFTLTNHERQLWDAGTKLSYYLQFPNAKLLPILQHIETLVLSSTGQVNLYNPESLKYARHQVIGALIHKRLLSHPDVDVNISVACCICAVIRTVVGYQPYNNEQMKDFFELVVITLEKLSSASRGCYPKMNRILELLSGGRFSVLMYDLQLNGLIIRLFRQFLFAADFNSAAVVLMMKKIMTVIINESKPLNSKLVKLLVRCVRRENKIPSSRRLGGDVLKSCAAQLKPYLPDRAQSVEHGENVVGSRIKIWSIKDEISYAVVKSYNCTLQMHKVLYDSGYEGDIYLKRQKWELVENVSVTPATLGKALPKMVSTLHSDKVFVQGYKVRSSIAPIVKAIFIKHGDIAAECVCKTASVRSSLLKVVCKAVRRIETSDVTTILSEFKEIERQVLDAEATNINVSWLLAHMEAIQKRNEAEKKSNLLMEMNVNTILVKRAAKIDLIERGTELESAEKLFEEAERYYQEVVTFFDVRNKRRKLLYDDGDEALLHLKPEQWELMQNMSDHLEPVVAINVSSPQSGTTCVQGYKVTSINAPILEAIFKKYGDIASDCVFKTASVRESILEVVCDVVRKILTNDVKTIISEMEQVDSQVSGAEANKINVSWLRAHLESIHKRNDDLKKYHVHLKMKENNSLVTLAAKMDLNKKRGEFMTAQQRSEEADRCVKVLHLVEQKLSDDILESKAEENKWAEKPII